MSEIDTTNALVASAHAVPDASAVAGVWKTPATPTGFTIQIDPNAGFWKIYDGTVYVAALGQGSVSLADAMRRLGIIL